MLQVLDEAAVRHWAVACADALAAQRVEIDSLNVFPVADRDTGSNLAATMRAAVDALGAVSGGGLSAAVAALARGALSGARGNSGVILSQVLRGLAEALTEVEAVTAVALRAGLLRADELARAAVSDPVPGTVLTVLHAAADAAARTDSDRLGDVATAAVDAAAGALADTPRQLAVLARAGVVDAGGRGLVVLLETLARVVHEQAAPIAPTTTPCDQHPVEDASDPDGYRYEVMYLLDGTDDERAGVLRERLASVGDCVSVVGDATLVAVHVHCDDIGAAIEAGIEAGRPHAIRVQRFADVSPGDAATGGADLREHAVVVLIEDAAELFADAGAVTAPDDVDVPDLVDVLMGTGARVVTLVPGPATLATYVPDAAAEQARDAGVQVVVVPVASPVQALAALAVHDPARRPTDDVVAMAEAAAATRRGEVRVADEDALTWVGRCSPGDALGLIDDEVVLIDPDPTAAATALLDRMLDTGGELVTVLLGRRAPAGLAVAVRDHLSSRPEIEFTLHPGGGAGVVLRVGVE